jgi:hypothetical protein
MNTLEQIRADIRELLNEAPASWTVPASQRIRIASCNYYATTPRGTKARFNRNVSISQLRGAHSETAVYYFLKQLHPSCEITIMNLEFR